MGYFLDTIIGNENGSRMKREPLLSRMQLSCRARARDCYRFTCARTKDAPSATRLQSLTTRMESSSMIIKSFPPTFTSVPAYFE